MALQIGNAGFERLEILGLEILLLHAAVHFKRADRRHQNHAIGRDAGLAALDVDELLAAEVSAEPSLGYHVIGKLERRRRRQDRVTAMRDIGERTAMDESRGAFEGLNQIGRERLLQKHRHGAMRLEVAGAESP